MVNQKSKQRVDRSALPNNLYSTFFRAMYEVDCDVYCALLPVRSTSLHLEMTFSCGGILSVIVKTLLKTFNF